MINGCKTPQDFNQLLENSKTRTILLFKHSTACGISRGAWERFQSFAADETEVEYWQVLVREDKALSDHIAAVTRIRHESPQVILFHEGKAIWKCSHHHITSHNLKRQLDRLGS